MRKIKAMSVLLTFVMLCSLLTGCVGNVGNVTINADGSGTITMSAGFTKEVIDMMSGMGEMAEGSTDINDMKPFTYNGVTYYGDTETVSFKSVDEFNSLINETDEEDPSNVDNGTFELIKNSDGSLALKIYTTSETGNTTAMEESAEEQFGMSEEELEMLMSQMAVVFEINFPYDVYQINGGIDGVKIDGKKLTLDFIEMGKHITKDTVYLFSTNPNENKLTTFMDVSADFWGYNAIEALAAGGLVSGIGGNKFAPNGDITYAQYCQIAARALGLETGSDETGYWAAKAIKSCLEKNIIFNRGDINSKNYDIPMTREAAVSAMYLLVKDNYNVIKMDITGLDIPDYNQISAEYRSNVLKAYNIGITGGVDSNRTFAPAANLTRAQVCQLFYNLGITSVPNAESENPVTKLPDERVLIEKTNADKLKTGMSYEKVVNTLGKSGLLVSIGAYQDAFTGDDWEYSVVENVANHIQYGNEFDLNKIETEFVKNYNFDNPGKEITKNDLVYKYVWNDFENNFTYTENGLYYGAEVTVYFYQGNAYMLLSTFFE